MLWYYPWIICQVQNCTRGSAYYERLPFLSQLSVEPLVFQILIQEIQIILVHRSFFRSLTRETFLSFLICDLYIRFLHFLFLCLEIIIFDLLLRKLIIFFSFRDLSIHCRLFLWFGLWIGSIMRIIGILHNLRVRHIW